MYHIYLYTYISLTWRKCSTPRTYHDFLDISTQRVNDDSQTRDPAANGYWLSIVSSTCTTHWQVTIHAVNILRSKLTPAQQPVSTTESYPPSCLTEVITRVITATYSGYSYTSQSGTRGLKAIAPGWKFSHVPQKNSNKKQQVSRNQQI